MARKTKQPTLVVEQQKKYRFTDTLSNDLLKLVKEDFANLYPEKRTVKDDLRAKKSWLALAMLFDRDHVEQFTADQIIAHADHKKRKAKEKLLELLSDDDHPLDEEGLPQVPDEEGWLKLWITRPAFRAIPNAVTTDPMQGGDEREDRVDGDVVENEEGGGSTPAGSTLRALNKSATALQKDVMARQMQFFEVDLPEMKAAQGEKLQVLREINASLTQLVNLKRASREEERSAAVAKKRYYDMGAEQMQQRAEEQKRRMMPPRFHY